MKRFVPVFLAVVFSLFLAVAAYAAGGASPMEFSDDIPNIVGLAIGMAPDYSGSDHMQVVPGGYARINLGGERYVQLLGTEINVNILNNKMFRFGPSVNYRFGRDDNVHDDVVKNMKKIDGTVEAGAFISMVLYADNPRQRFIATLDALHDVGGVSHGSNVTLSARYWYPISKPIDISLGASTTYANSSFMKTYYGVNSGNVGTSGLPFFDTKGGVRDFSLSPAMVFHFNKTWHLAAGVRWQHLVDSAKASPVVSQRGSADQFLPGVGVAYAF
jgi:outer membrane protein